MSSSQRLTPWIKTSEETWAKEKQKDKESFNDKEKEIVASDKQSWLNQSPKDIAHIPDLLDAEV